MLAELFPDTARIEGGELVLGGVGARALAQEFGTPLVVYDEATLRAQARAYLEAAPGALIAYGTKAFPSVAVLPALRKQQFHGRHVSAESAATSGAPTSSSRPAGPSGSGRGGPAR